MSKTKLQELAAALEDEFGWETLERQGHRVDGNPWREEPLSLIDFVRSPDHLGLDLYPEQRADLEGFLGYEQAVPRIVDKRGLLEGDRYDVYPGTHPKLLFDASVKPTYNQAFLLWGKGSGKDTVCSFLQCWIAHILLCLHDPQEYLGLPPGESIDIPVIGYSETQAKSVYFEKFKTRLKSWKWLKATIKDRTGLDGDRWLREHGEYVHEFDVELPFKIKCWSLNSSLGSSEGKNVLFWILDELAAFTSPVKKNLAREIHNLVVSSARSRFLHRWRGVAISFPRHKQDHTMAIASEVASGVIEDTYVSIKPTWVVRPDRTRQDFEADFRRDPEDAGTKYGCNPPAQVDAYFRSPDLLLLHATGAPIDLLRQHLDLEEYQLEAIASRGQNPITAVDQFGDPLLDRRGFPRLARWLRGQSDAGGQPYEYFVHLDPGRSGDSYGFAMGHIHKLEAGFQPCIDLAFRWTGGMFRDFGEIYRQSWFPDELEQTEAIAAAEVDFRTVREFIYFLRQARGFNISVVSTDNWNSVENVQALRKRDFVVVERIVDKEDYDEYKTLVYNRQLRYYGQPVLIEESLKLQLLNGTKVDAPRTSEGEGAKKDSHKDVSDAVAAVCRRMAVMQESGISFVDFALDLDIKKEAPATIELGGAEGMSEVQRSLLSQFFGE